MPKKTLAIRKRYVQIYGKHLTNFQLSNILGVTERTIVRYRVVPKIKRFTEEEITYLKNNYKKVSSQDLAKYLGRNVHSVRVKLSQLGLVRPKRFQNALAKQSFKKAIADIRRDRNKRREAKALRLIKCQSELLTRKCTLLQLINDATEYGNTNNHEVIMAQKELADIEKTEQEMEEKYRKILPIRAQNEYLI